MQCRHYIFLLYAYTGRLDGGGGVHVRDTYCILVLYLL